MPYSSSTSAQFPSVSPILSEDYADIIFRNQISDRLFPQTLDRYFPQPVDYQYSILHAPLSDNLSTVEELSYSSVPKLFTFVDTTSLEVSGILSAQTQPYLQLSGAGVLIGFLDSGIDYTHPAFRNSDGSSRILRIWDQTIQSDHAPGGLSYGTEYTKEQIDTALRSSTPYSLVPSRDTIGHGTAVAGIACGSADPSSDFSGAAPVSQLLIVKLKPAKQYLRDYFLIPESATVYQESDLMLGIRYLVQTSQRLRMPLVICFSLGSSQGSHTGTSPLEEVLTSAQANAGIYAVAGTGNETGTGHHFRGTLTSSGDSTEIELLINAETRGFTVEFWADAPELYSIGFTSPLGETIQPVQPRNNISYSFDFLLEESRITLTYTLVELLTGSQLALMRFQTPSQGIWRIRVVNKTFINGVFHLWLPITNLVDPEVRFYDPSADTTLVIPSCAASVLTTSTYNASNNSLFSNSGRGFTRNNLIKPDFASPGVSVTAPKADGAYTTLTGSCAASALASGAAALFAEAGLRQEVPRYFSTEELKSLFLRGTKRSSIYSYPNREWGYGTMNVFASFESFLR